MFRDPRTRHTRPPLPAILFFAGMTNRPDLIDDALMRPGRFEVKMEISELFTSDFTVLKSFPINPRTQSSTDPYF